MLQKYNYDYISYQDKLENIYINDFLYKYFLVDIKMTNPEIRTIVQKLKNLFRRDMDGAWEKSILLGKLEKYITEITEGVNLNTNEEKNNNNERINNEMKKKVKTIKKKVTKRVIKNYVSSDSSDSSDNSDSE